MQSTPSLGLPLIAAEQAQKHITHNEALGLLDALVQLAVADRDLAVPPASPAARARYIVPAGASGAWAGHAHKVAVWDEAGWTMVAPRTGWLAWVEDEALLVAYDGGGWTQAINIGTVASLGIAATADATNRLAVASPAALFTHGGTDHRLTINKAGAGHTASVVWQSGFSGRAELGLAGSDDLALKVSTDGTTWREALRIERDSGAVRLPATASAENLLINGDFRINQRKFAGGSLAAGGFGHDRWKADAGGASYSVSGGTVALASGALVQVVQPAFHGHAHFAGRQLTFSVENPSADLSIGIGASSAVLAAGAGRRSVTLTLGGGETGNVVVKVARSGAGPVSFERLKLEIGPLATAWQPRPLATELAFCQRYYVEFGNSADGYHYFGNVSMRSSTLGLMYVALPVPMQAVPTLTTLGAFVALDGGGGVTTIALARHGGHYVELALTFAAGVPGTSWPVYASNDTTARLKLSAEP